MQLLPFLPSHMNYLIILALLSATFLWDQYSKCTAIAFELNTEPVQVSKLPWPYFIGPNEIRADFQEMPTPEFGRRVTI